MNSTSSFDAVLLDLDGVLTSTQTIAGRKQAHFERALDDCGVTRGASPRQVDMRSTGTTCRLLEGRGLPIRHFGEALRLTPDAPLHRPADPAQPFLRAA